MAAVENSVSVAEFKRGPHFLVTPVVIGVAVFTACVLGILTRPIGFFAMIWPANAVLLGLLIRLPDTHRVSVWLSAGAAYMAADLAAGSGIEKSFVLNSTNLCGVAAAYLVYQGLPQNVLRMREPASVLYIVVVSVVGAATSGLAGAIADPVLLKLGAANAGMLWFATELVNYIALLPVLLCARKPRGPLPAIRSPDAATCVRSAVPATALVASCVLAMVIGGPGAMAFAVPALLWCALAYSVCTVAVLALVFSCWSLTVMCAPYFPDVGGVYDGHSIASVRLAAFMIALAPITLSIVMRDRDALIKRLALARQRVDLALDAGGVVTTWDMNLSDGDPAAEKRFPTRFEIAGESGDGKLTASIHPDDRARVSRALGAAIASGADYRCRYRIVLPSGEIRQVAAFGKPMCDRKGAVSHLVGILVDITKQTEAVEALEQSDKRFNIVSESIPQIVWSADAKGRHDYFNRRWTEFTGIPADAITPDMWKDLVHAEDKPRVDAAWTASLASGQTYSIDYRFRYRDGTYRWLKVLAKPLRNAEGVITRWYGTSTDIDDAKQVEAVRELVARELDHRIGNLFALVNGLVTLTLRDASDVKAVTDTLRGRLKALHDAHNLMRRKQDGSSATMAELIRRLLAPYGDGEDRITITGDDLTIDPSTMTAIALIFHELATNAVKYGALGGNEGSLRIELSRLDDRFKVRWLEISHSLPAAGEGTGFGSRLFDSIIEGQLHGKATRSVSPEGLSMEIDFPVSSLAHCEKG